MAMSLVSSNGGDQLLDSQLQNQMAAAPPVQPNPFENVMINQQIPPNFNNNSFQNQPQMFQDNLAPSFGYGVSDLSENSSFDQSMNSSGNNTNNNGHSFSFDSVLSTPLSSPPAMNSAPTTTLVNVGGEEERESFSNLLGFEVPESLNLDDFMYNFGS